MAVRHRQSARQVAVADRILLTKGDLAEPSPALDARLQRLNPGASRLPVAHGAIAASTLFDERRPGSGTLGGYVPVGAGTRASIAGLAAIDPAAVHDPRIASWCLLRERPLHALTLSLFLEGLMEHCGDRLLRVKAMGLNTIQVHLLAFGLTRT